MMAVLLLSLFFFVSVNDGTFLTFALKYFIIVIVAIVYLYTRNLCLDNSSDCNISLNNKSKKESFRDEML